MKRKITLMLLTALVFETTSNAQLWLGNTFGNYSGTNGVYLNPSSIAESKYAYHLNFWGHGANIYNNYLNYSAPIGMRDWIQNDNSVFQNNKGKIGFQQSWLSEYDLTGTKQFSLTQDIRYPGFMFPVGPKANMSFNLRQRSGVQSFGMSSEFARVLRNGIDTNNVKLFGGSNPLQKNKFYDMGNISSNTDHYQELGITYAGNWSETKYHKFNAGATIKFVRGLGGAYFNTSGGKFAINNSDSMTFVDGDYNYGHTPYTNIRQPIENDYQVFYPSAGGGIGLDLGFTYMYNPNPEKYFKANGCNENNKRDNYLLKFAAAVNDIGFIKYGTSTVYNKKVFSDGLRINHSLASSFGDKTVDGFDTLDGATVQRLGFDQSNGYTSQLPTALNVSADFRASKRFFVGLNWNQDLKNSNAIGLRSSSQLAVIPRFEFRGLEVSAPIVWGQNYQKVTMGLYARLGPVFVGSENLNGFLNKASNSAFSGADIYGGIAAGIGHCPLWVRDNYDEDIVRYDTIEKRDTIKQIEKDTILEQKTDTLKETRIKETKDSVIKYVYKVDTVNRTITKRDTVFFEKLVTNKEYEAAIAKREGVVTERERQVAQRERQVSIRERYNNCADCEKEKDNLKIENAKLANENIQLKKTIADRVTKINELDREIVVLKNRKNQLDTVKIFDCGPATYADEATNKYYNKCDYLTLVNARLKSKIALLEQEKNALENDLFKCQISKDSCCGNVGNIDNTKTDELEKARLEAERIRLEAAKKKSEEEAKAKELEKNRQEEARKKAEAERQSNEEARKRAEEERIKKEQEKVRQEEARIQAEKVRQQAEAARQAAEEARKRAEESARQKELEKARQEEARKQAEEARKAAEAARQKATEKARQEAARKQAEEERQAAEEARKKLEEEQKNRERR